MKRSWQHHMQRGATSYQPNGHVVGFCHHLLKPEPTRSMRLVHLILDEKPTTALIKVTLTWLSRWEKMRFWVNRKLSRGFFWVEWFCWWTKSCTTWDVWQLVHKWYGHYRLPIKYQVVHDFSHQQYQRQSKIQVKVKSWNVTSTIPIPEKTLPAGREVECLLSFVGCIDLTCKWKHICHVDVGAVHSLLEVFTRQVH